TKRAPLLAENAFANSPPRHPAPRIAMRTSSLAAANARPPIAAVETPAAEVVKKERRFKRGIFMLEFLKHSDWMRPGGPVPATNVSFRIITVDSRWATKRCSVSGCDCAADQTFGNLSGAVVGRDFDRSRQ